MSSAVALDVTGPQGPVNVTSRAFIENKYAWYAWLRDNAPVHKGKLSVLNAYFVSRYDDCVSLLRDERFVRNRTKATGGGRMPFPMPKSVAVLAKSMIVEDEPEHRRLRNLVKQSFLPSTMARVESRLGEVTHELLDTMPRGRTVDLLDAYATPIPVTVIAELVGISQDDMPRFRHSISVLSKGMSGWSILRSLLWDMRVAGKFVRELIDRKRADPQDDILSALIHAEEEGSRLSEDEIVSMVFLLIIAGYETTSHLITNGVLTLLEHPEQLERLRAEPHRMESTVEEILRFRGPIHGTKPAYAMEDVTLHGVTIPKGSTVMPLLGAANHDPEVFEAPEVFDIARSPNRHLGFGFGIHFCLGARLARMETRVALGSLIERCPDVRLAVDPRELRLQSLPLWHRYESLPVSLG